jgi:hypothetical protein
LKHEVALQRGLAYLNRCNSGWFCHRGGAWAGLHRGLRELGLGAAHAGKGRRGDWAARERRAGPRREEKRAGGVAGLGCLLFFLLLSFFFSTLKLFKQFYLNSNKFKINAQTMLQHECTNKLIL